MPLPKGRTNNPHGRPRKNSSLTEALRNYVLSNKKLTITGYTDMNAREALIRKLIKMALIDGEVAAMKYIFDRLDGRPIETLRASLERGDMKVMRSLQKELFDFEEEGGGDGGTGDMEPPAEAGGSAGE